VANAVVLGLSLVAFSLILYSSFSRALRRQFDERLGESARSIADMVEERAAEPWELELADIEEFKPKKGAAYFEIRMDDGTVLLRSPSLGNGALNAPMSSRGPVFENIRLPDGRPGRLMGAWLKPRHDTEENGPPSGRLLRVAVARATVEVDATLVMLRLLLLISGLSVLALSLVAGAVAVRKGLAPVAALMERVDGIEADDLGARLPVASLPRELRPPVIKLNELLSRLEQSFMRERRFSADVSHELRTPLAGLRAILEVAASRDRTMAEYRAAIEVAIGIVCRMTGLAESLLMLARLDASALTPTTGSVDIAELVGNAFERRAEKARERGLKLENRVPAGTRLNTDRDMLAIAIANLLSNAVAYTARDGTVRVETDLPRGAVLRVWDSGPPIPDDALEKIFERFFRLDPSRAGGEALGGIGLALARALCEALGMTVRAENGQDGSVAFTISR